MQYLELILEKHIYFMMKSYTLSLMKNGLISELFAGIAPNISRVFRYRTLYFFKDNSYLLYKCFR
jgi:hypothetical protein